MLPLLYYAIFNCSLSSRVTLILAHFHYTASTNILFLLIVFMLYCTNGDLSYRFYINRELNELIVCRSSSRLKVSAVQVKAHDWKKQKHIHFLPFNNSSWKQIKAPTCPPPHLLIKSVLTTDNYNLISIFSVWRSTAIFWGNQSNKLKA